MMWIGQGVLMLECDFFYDGQTGICILIEIQVTVATAKTLEPKRSLIWHCTSEICYLACLLEKYIALLCNCYHF